MSTIATSPSLATWSAGASLDVAIPFSQGLQSFISGRLVLRFPFHLHGQGPVVPGLRPDCFEPDVDLDAHVPRLARRERLHDLLDVADELGLADDFLPNP